MWYFQTHQTNGIVSQMIETPLHLSTHLDSEMHGVSGGRDIASVSLDQCVGPAAIVDISEVGEWGVYTPELVQSKVEVRPRDILILHAGWARYYAGMPEEDLTRYFCKHPGPDHRFAAWAVAMKFRWIGVDCGSAMAFGASVQNLGGDLALVLNRRCVVGAFPWKFVGGEASICRIVAFLDLPEGQG